MQTQIPAVMMRDGTSKGLYFLASDLPSDVATRDKVLLAAMGSSDATQIDGMVGADPLTSKIAIVSQSAASVMVNSLDLAGSACGSLLPTGNVIDNVDGIRVTCIDNGMPVVLMAAADMGATGYETRDEMNADTELKARIEAIRLKIGEKMNLGDVTDKVVPKMCLVAPPIAGGAIHTRCFIPHVCRASIGVLAAVTVATACAIQGTVVDGIVERGDDNLIAVEHPMGEFTDELEVDGPPEALKLKRAALLRTTRRLFEGNVLIPAEIWDGKQNLSQAAE